MQGKEEFRVIQVNCNHSRGSQDMIEQLLAEGEAEVAIVSEPYRVPGSGRWAGDLRGVAAVVRSPNSSITWKVTHRGERFVAVKSGSITIASVYASPALDLAAFEGLLDDVANCVGGGGDLLVAGDFNAAHGDWGSARDGVRGNALRDWAASLGLSLLNVGRVPTCVREQGTSIVDISWARGGPARGVSWTVDETQETLSDHRIIRIGLSDGCLGRIPRKARMGWREGAFSEESFDHALAGIEWTGSWERGDLEERLRVLRESLIDLSDAAMPRRGGPPRKSAVFWWSGAIEELRARCIGLRRAMQRKARRGLEVRSDTARWKRARKALRKEIDKSRKKEWEDLIGTVNDDPWGRPYSIVMGRMRSRGDPPLLNMGTGEAEAALDSLFPRGRELRRLEAWGGDLEENERITRTELEKAAKRIPVAGRAPGPDGILGIVLRRLVEGLPDLLTGVFNECLRSGTFPEEWKEALLVLIGKPGGKFRPICLLSVVGKLLERVLANRIVRLALGAGHNSLSERQFGFLPGRSTHDAVAAVRGASERARRAGQGCALISLDIKNAFNTIEWFAILGALERYDTPPYLSRMVASYLSDRRIIYETAAGSGSRRVNRGVPQGSVLGPLLWVIAYDGILRLPVPRGCRAFCFADDTMLVVRGESAAQIRERSGEALKRIEGKLTSLGLKISIAKTNVLLINSGGPNFGSATTVRISGTEVEASGVIKYLGYYLNGSWRFREHISRVAEKASRVMAALSRLTPNLRGPKERTRRLYLAVVTSVMMYGAPVWGPVVEGRVLSRLRRVHRSMVIRVIAGYRTVSYSAACALAGVPPVDLLAGYYARTFKEVREEGLATAGSIKEIKERARRDMIGVWRQRLAGTGREGRVVRDWIHPVLEQWMDRRRGRLHFHLTQVLTGHGCFGTFLFRIGREESAICRFCDSGERDDNRHTLMACEAWRDIREDEGWSGPDWDDLARWMLRSAGNWRCASRIALRIMSSKEAAERERQGQPAAGNMPGD